MSKGPVLIDLEGQGNSSSVTDAPPVPDPGPPAPTGQAMQATARLAARRPSMLVRLFWAVALALITGIASAAAWTFVSDWMARAPLVGWTFTSLFAAFLLVLLAVAAREMGALGRLRRLDHLHHTAEEALSRGDLASARRVASALDTLYGKRPDMAWARDRFNDLRPDQLDAQGLLHLAEAELMTPLDRAAAAEVEAAARQVATITALVPLALADVFAALTANIRMIRRIAEIYGGRGGTLGSWRLTRAVMTHLVATGAVAVGDDMLEPLVGGSILGKLSRRFGEGLVNGALTARVGVAAIEVCRPLPFAATPKPKARQMMKNALTGLFDREGADAN